MTRRLRLGIALLTLAAAAAALPGQASATFHEMSIREVYPGSSSDSNAEYVELQMYSSGQEFVKGHVLKVFNAGGALVDETTFASDVPSGQNQRTVLIATTEAESALGFTADETMSPSGQLNPAGGAVCWESLDCVSWGNFTGSPPSPAGQPAEPAGIPDGMALRRKISANCATLLEATDDTDSSAADFETVFPDPRPNSATPAEKACSSNSGGGGANDGRGKPQTKLKAKPARRTRDRTPTFRFVSDEKPSKFFCKLDGKPFRSCRSPFTTPKLKFGRHTFKVKASHEGTVDPTPAVWRFKVLPPRR